MKSDDKCSFEDNFHGSVTVGERGQIVIPAEARRKFRIETGDKLLVFSHPAGGGLLLAKVDALEGMLHILSQSLKRAQELHREGEQ